MEKFSYRTLITIVVLLLIGIVAIVRLQQKPRTVLAEWWNDNWSYRQTINIATHTAAELNVYIIATINIGTTIKAQPDDGDFRFTDSSGQLLDYFISSNAGTTAPTFHIQIPSFASGSQTLYAYYGNQTISNGFQNTDFATQATNYSLGSNGAEEKGLGPIVFWKFDEGYGTTIFDSSSNNKNGVLGSATSAPTWIAEDRCNSGKCLQFDGTNDKVSLGTSVTFIQTISFWMRPSTTAPNIVDFDGGTHFISATNSQLSASGFSSPTIYVNGIATTAFDVNEWSQVTVSTGTSFSATALTLGKVSTNFYNGFLDSFKIYNYVRSAAQVKLDYNSSGTAVGAEANLGSDSQSFLTDGLVGYWKMDEGTNTTIIDSSGNSNTATLGTGTSAPSWVSGKYGKGLSFNGTSNFVTAANSNSLNPTNSVTVSAWVNPSAFSNPDNIIVDKTNANLGYRLLVTSAGQPRFTVGDGSGYGTEAQSSVNISTNTWTHLVGKYENNTLSIYVNGVLTGTSTKSYGGPSSGTLTIGTRTTEFYSGTIDEVRIYNQSLSPAEIQKLYISAPGPVVYYKMDENTSTTNIFDSSGNGIFGTISNFSAWRSGRIGSALEFNNSNTIVNIGNSSVTNDIPSTGITISSWVYPRSRGSAGRIFEKISTSTTFGYVFRFNTSTDIPFLRADFDGASDMTIDAADPLPMNQWTFITVTWDGSASANNAHIYYNGVEQLNPTRVDGVGNRTSDAAQVGIIGGVSSGTPHTFDGLIDELKIYNYIRSPKQIIEDMNGSTSLSKKSPIAYYKFDEGYGTTTNNSGSVGSTLHATLATGNSSPTWSNNGNVGKALSFSTNNYLTIGNTTPIYTVSLWYNTSNTAPTFFDFSTTVNTGATGATFYGTGISSPTFYVDGIATSNIGTTNTWHHFVMTTNSQITANALKIGKASTRYHSGLIDEVKIYNYPLSPADISTDYNQSSAIIIGSLSNNTSNTSPVNASSQQYCVPGDSSVCSPPIAEYKFDSNVGTTIYDSSDNNYFGTMSGNATWASGKFGSGLLLDGNGDFVNVSQTTVFDFGTATPFTYSTWVKASSNGASNQDLITGQLVVAGYADLWISSTGIPRAWIQSIGSTNSCTIDGTTIVNDSRWHNITAVYNRNASCTTNDILIYVDGKKETTSVATSNGNTNANIDVDRIRFGATGSTSVNGLIDEFKIYNYARTASQISWDYNQGKPVRFWKFDECQGSTIYDSIGSGTTGTITVGASGSQSSLGTCTLGTGTSSAWTNGSIGKINSSFSFDGTDDVINVGSTLSLNAVSFWIKPTAISSNKFIQLSSTVNIGATGNTISATGFTSPTIYINGIGTTALTAGIWQHVAISSGSTIVANAIKIGQATTFFTGFIDDLKLFNYPLTNSQVKNLYNSSTANF